MGGGVSGEVRRYAGLVGGGAWMDVHMQQFIMACRNACNM